MLAATALMLGAASNAHAGTWLQATCLNPDGSAAGSDGWSTVIAGGGYGSNASSACGPGSPMYAVMSTAAAVGVGSQETLRYIPPAGSTLNGGTVTVSMAADGFGYNASGTTVLYTPEYAYDGANVFFQCASGLAACSPAGAHFTGTLTIPAGRGGNLYVSAGCGGNAGAICNTGGSEGAWSSIHLSSAVLRLTNTSTPTGGGYGGTLLAGTARGKQDLSLSAGDPGGPGVYEVTVEADGQTLYSATPDSNDGRCVPVGSSSGALMFDASQPCKTTEAVLAPIDTAGLTDGAHTLKINVTDAAGNSSVVYDSALTTHNAPTSTSPPTLSETNEPTTLSASAGAWIAPADAGAISYGYQWQNCNAAGEGCRTIPGARAASYTPTAADAGHALRVVVSAADRDGSSSLASEPSTMIPGTSTGLSAAIGVPNGSGASEAARVQLTGPATIARSYTRRTVTIAGQLLDGSGKPIGDATLDVRQQLQGSASAAVVGFVKTNANGTFLASAGNGPSRQILIGYRAFSSDPAYSAQASVKAAVQAGVRMHISPRHTTPGGTIQIAGTVNGPIPRSGVVVTLLVRYRGRWEPFREPRTDAHGRFHIAYHFQGALGRFPFRAKVLGEQAGLPYTTGQSTAIIVGTS